MQAAPHAWPHMHVLVYGYSVQGTTRPCPNVLHGVLQPGRGAFTLVSMQVFGGRSAAFFKLHTVAMHLADQVRACGASFFAVEYWVERLVQLLKRMIKYMSTAFPELLLIHDWLLVVACRRVRRIEERTDLQTLEEAIESIRAAKRRTHDTADEKGCVMFGAPQKPGEAELNEGIPEYTTGDGEAGLGSVVLCVSMVASTSV